ncbi:hypothetical protein [Mucilaginibacter sp. MD40]|uniref:hypothetical protein n=1 Tax=Mucilaginibacter sp. MD40 TaxID=2029590 RepID=UPI0013045138|nr:hypothetical protein [Mucilaginibacter sp. MD40]
MLKFLKFINVVGLVKRIIKYGDHITLIADTAKYWHTEAEKRGLIGNDAPAQVTE